MIKQFEILNFGHWDLFEIWDLRFEIWDFNFPLPNHYATIALSPTRIIKMPLTLTPRDVDSDRFAS